MVSNVIKTSTPSGEGEKKWMVLPLIELNLASQITLIRAQRLVVKIHIGVGSSLAQIAAFLQLNCGGSGGPLEHPYRLPQLVGRVDILESHHELGSYSHDNHVEPRPITDKTPLRN